MGERTITVKGVGHVSVKPDLVVVSVLTKAITPDYAKTMEDAIGSVEVIRDAIAAIGYKKDDLQIVDFKINPEYEYYKEENGDCKRRFIGYKCVHALKLELGYDMKWLGETLLAISRCGAASDYRVGYSVKDKAAVTDMLLNHAIANAKNKASALARATGVTLGSIQNIDYSYGELRMLSDKQQDEDMAAMFSETGEGDGLKFEPKDIEAHDFVTIVWSLV